MGAGDTSLEALNFGLELLDDCMALLKILIQTVTLVDELLFPSSESLFLDLDLLCEPLSERLFLLFELGVVQLSWSRLAEFASLHLLSAIHLVVVLLGRVNQVKHVVADENRSKLLEVAVLLVFDLCDTPCVLTALDAASVSGLDVLLGSYNGEWHGVDELAGVLEHGLVIVLERWRVDLDALCLYNCSYLLLVSANCSISPNAVPYSVLEPVEIGRAKGICLGHDGNEVDPCA